MNILSTSEHQAKAFSSVALKLDIEQFSDLVQNQTANICCYNGITDNHHRVNEYAKLLMENNRDVQNSVEKAKEGHFGSSESQKGVTKVVITSQLLNVSAAAPSVVCCQDSSSCCTSGSMVCPKSDTIPGT